MTSRRAALLFALPLALFLSTGTAPAQEGASSVAKTPPAPKPAPDPAPAAQGLTEPEDTIAPPTGAPMSEQTGATGAPPPSQEMVPPTVEKFGGLHGLLNAAGVGVRNSIEDCSLAEYRRVNDINGLGTFLGCKAAIPAMKAAGGGSIVNISSVLGLRGASYAMAYCASKGAVRLLTKHVALHCAQQNYNIRCNSVHPGYIDTPMIAPRLDQPVGNRSGRQWLEELHPLGRLGRAEEVATMILFLLSDESSFSTGSEFVCDGGLTA